MIRRKLDLEQGGGESFLLLMLPYLFEMPSEGREDPICIESNNKVESYPSANSNRKESICEVSYPRSPLCWIPSLSSPAGMLSSMNGTSIFHSTPGPLHVRYRTLSFKACTPVHISQPPDITTFYPEYMGRRFAFRSRTKKFSIHVTSSTQIPHLPRSQVRPLSRQDTPPPAEPLEPRAPEREGGRGVRQTAPLQNDVVLDHSPAVGVQLFRAGDQQSEHLKINHHR